MDESKIPDDAPKAKRPRGNPNWIKGGPSPNPKGRPRSGMALSDMIRRKVDPQRMVDIALAIADGRPVPMLDEAGEPTNDMSSLPTCRDRLAALTWIRDSGFFKPAQLTVTADVPIDTDGIDYNQLSDAALDAVLNAQSAACAELGIGDDDDGIIDVYEAEAEPEIEPA